MNKFFVCLCIVTGALTHSSFAADIQQVIDTGSAIIKNAALGAYETGKPLIGTGQLAVSQTKIIADNVWEALKAWKDNVLGVYNADNSSVSGDTASITNNAAFAGGSVATLVALLVLLYKVPLQMWAKVPLSLLLVPSGVPVFVAVRNLIKQIVS